MRYVEIMHAWKLFIANIEIQLIPDLVKVYLVKQLFQSIILCSKKEPPYLVKNLNLVKFYTKNFPKSSGVYCNLLIITKNSPQILTTLKNT